MVLPNNENGRSTAACNSTSDPHKPMLSQRRQTQEHLLHESVCRKGRPRYPKLLAVGMVGVVGRQWVGESTVGHWGAGRALLLVWAPASTRVFSLPSSLSLHSRGTCTSLWACHASIRSFKHFYNNYFVYSKVSPHATQVLSNLLKKFIC